MLTDKPSDQDEHQKGLAAIKLQAFSGRRGAFVWQALRMGLAHNVSLVLIGHVNYAPLGLLLKLIRPSLRYGVMVHGVDVWSQVSWLKRLALKNADFITSVSQYTRHEMASANGVDRQRVYLLPNALEWQENESEEASPPENSTSTVRLLTVCRFSKDERYKGVDHVIGALPSIQKRVPNVQYYVVGTGDDLERHKELVLSLGVDNQVHFLGSLDAESLRAQYRACDIFVMPSAGEGFGIVFLEAMRYAKPVVAAASGAVPEVVENGTSGILVSYGDKKQLEEALIELSLNPEQRKRMGQAGHQRLQENFTFGHFRETLSTILMQETKSEVSASVAAPSTEGMP